MVGDNVPARTAATVRGSADSRRARRRAVLAVRDEQFSARERRPVDVRDWSDGPHPALLPREEGVTGDEAEPVVQPVQLDRDVVQGGVVERRQVAVRRASSTQCGELLDLRPRS